MCDATDWPLLSAMHSKACKSLTYHLALYAIACHATDVIKTVIQCILICMLFTSQCASNLETIDMLYSCYAMSLLYYCESTGIVCPPALMSLLSADVQGKLDPCHSSWALLHPPEFGLQQAQRLTLLACLLSSTSQSALQGRLVTTL